MQGIGGNFDSQIAKSNLPMPTTLSNQLTSINNALASALALLGSLEHAVDGGNGGEAKQVGESSFTPLTVTVGRIESQVNELVGRLGTLSGRL